MEEKGMRRMMFLALGAMFAANVFAAEQQEQRDCGKQLSKEERVEFDIKRLTNELMLSDQQAEKFAVTYREYAAKLDELFESGKPEKFEPGKELKDADLDKLAKQRFEGMKKLADLQSKFYDKFRKDLSARQTARVMRLNDGCGQGPCCGKHDFKHDGKPDFKHDGKHDGPKPDGFEPRGPRPDHHHGR